MGVQRPCNPSPKVRPPHRTSAVDAVIGLAQASLLLLLICHSFIPVVPAQPHTASVSRATSSSPTVRSSCAFVGGLGFGTTRVTGRRHRDVDAICQQANGGGIERTGVVVLAEQPGGGGTSGAGRRRKPRGNHVRKDAAGLPVEKVYAPRQSHYGSPTSGGSGRAKRVRPQGEDREVAINNAARLKVAGGVVKGRRLESPDVFLRPMMGKVKEALFNTLNGFGVFETGEARFLDLFSGSGSVGIEALSRGAGYATFVDLAKDCCEVCLRNANICGFDEQATAVRGDVVDVLYNPRRYGLLEPFDVVTVTPPYEEVVYADLIKALAQSDLVDQDTIVVIEYPVELGCLPHAIGDGTMVGLRNRRYGRTVLGLWVYLPSGQHGDMIDSRPQEFVSLKK